MMNIAVWKLVDDTIKEITECPECHSKRHKKSGRDWVKSANGNHIYIQKLQCLECGRNYREFVKKND